MIDYLARLDEKKQQLDRLRPLPADFLTSLDEWFRVELTYTSNALEGNTLSRNETALVVEKGITVAGKTLREHLEAVNHADALDYIKSLAGKSRSAIKESTIKDIQRLILARIDDQNAGRYRRVPVRIAGSTVSLPDPIIVPELMEKFITWLHGNETAHPATFAAQAHHRLVSIHPFTDGNGRTARLLMNLILTQEGFPPAVIRKQDRLRYIDSIEKAQLGGSLDSFLELVYEAIQRSLDIYLDTAVKILPLTDEPDMRVRDGRKTKEAVSLVKIGELARRSGEAVHTIRFWTKEGLLEVKAHTPGGYQLYDPAALQRIKEIRRLQKENRLTLAEIRDYLKYRHAAE